MYGGAFESALDVLSCRITLKHAIIPNRGVRPSTVEGANGGANTLFGTVDTLFDTVDREGVGNEEGANLLLLPPLWSALVEHVAL